MNIFLSYASARRDTALRLKLALEAEQHEVFFDRDDLGAGEAFHQAIRDAVVAADLFIFLVSPESVAAGSYTLAELGMAQAAWPRPARRVLPVVVAPTSKASIPAYLMAVTLLEPQGELVAETLRAVAALARPRRTKLLAVGAAVAVIALVAAVAVTDQQAQARRQLQAEQTRLADAAQRSARLCSDGSHADGFGQLTTLAAQPAAPPAVRIALQDCTMAWLRAARTVRGGVSFTELTAPMRPVLAYGLAAGASGARAADLRAHLGWADSLLRYDERSAGADPTPHYRQALQDDPGNVYGHAMWAHWLLLRNAGDSAEALGHFEAAVKSERDTPFVRSLQLGVLVGAPGREALTLQVLDQMRQRGESVHESRHARIWSSLYGTAYRPGASAVWQALPAEDGLKTFLWLFPRNGVASPQQALWRLVHAMLLAQAGRAAEARPDLLALQHELRAERASGPLPGAVDRLLTAR